MTCLGIGLNGFTEMSLVPCPIYPCYFRCQLYFLSEYNYLQYSLRHVHMKKTLLFIFIASGSHFKTLILALSVEYI